MDLQDQLKKLFPEHVTEEAPSSDLGDKLWLQEEPLRCKYEKRRALKH